MLGSAFAWNKTKIEYLGYCDHFEDADGRKISAQVGFYEHCKVCVHWNGESPGKDDKEFSPGCIYEKIKSVKPFGSPLLQKLLGWLRPKFRVKKVPVVLYRTEVFAGESQKGGPVQYFCRNCNYEMSPNIFETEVWEGCTCPKCMAVITKPKVLKNGEEIPFNKPLCTDEINESSMNSMETDENGSMNNQ